MAKISESKLQLLRPEFGDANALLLSGLNKLETATKPFETAMNNNFTFRKDEATGLLNQYIAQNDPNAAGFQDGLAKLMQSVNGLGNGVNQNDIAKSVIAQQVAQPVNQQRALANQNLTDERTVNQAYNALIQAGGTPEAEQAYYDTVGNTGVNGIAPLQGAETHNAQMDALKNAPLASLAKILADSGLQSQQIESSLGIAKGSLQQLLAAADSGGGKGKSQGQTMISQGGYSSNLTDAITSSLTGTESGGNSKAFRTNTDGRSFGGLLQMGDARLRDYANANKTKAIKASQFKNLSANEQKNINDWHINDLIGKAESTGAVGKTIKGIPVTLSGLVAVAHLGGSGGMDKFVRTNGAYDPADQLGTRLSDYLRKHSGSVSGNMGGGSVPYQGNFVRDTQLLENQGALSNQYSQEKMKALGDIAQSVLGNKRGAFSRPTVQLPGQTDSNYGALIDGITENYNRDSNFLAASTGNIMQEQSDNIAGIRQNQNESALVAQAKDAAGRVSVNALIDDSKGFKDWLATGQIDTNTFNQLDKTEQKAYIKAWNDYELGIKANSEKTYSIKGAKPVTDLVKDSKGAFETLKEINRMNTEKDFRSDADGFLPSWDILPGKNASQKRENLDKISMYIISDFDKALVANADLLDNKLTPKSRLNMIQNVQKKYFKKAKYTNLKSEDFEGVSDRIINPNLLREIINEEIQSGGKLIINKQREAMLKDKAKNKLPDITALTRKSILNQ